MFEKQRFGAVFAEFLGTFILASVALGAARYFNFTAAWYVAVAVGITLVTLVTMLGRVSGAHVNPAITIGLWTLRRIDSVKAIVYVAAQMLGGAVALASYEYITNSDVLMAGSSTIDWRMYVAEAIGAAIFGFGVAAAVTQKLEGLQAAYTIGASLFIGVIVASMAAPGFVNPAVALANNTWDWIVVTAPIFGSVIGMNLYNMFLAPLATESVRPASANTRRNKK